MQKKTMVLVGTAGAALAPTALVPAAQAADMAVKAPVLPPIVSSWAGFYIGGHVGGAWQQSTSNSSYGSITVQGSGVIGGGQIGYNWQRGNFVYGIEADGSGLGNAARSTLQGTSYSGKIDWLSTVRGRMGLAVNDTMVYATGGLAIGGVKNSIGVPGRTPAYSDNRTQVGWTIGGGVEHMWTPNWTIGLEALFVDLGKSKDNSGGLPRGKSSFSNQAVIGRFKVNYKF
jgi:outer membrane immunogenic protein